MDAMSIYNRDYTVKLADPAKTAKKKFTMDLYPPPLDDLTCYRVDYIDHGPACIVSKKTQAELIAEAFPHCVPFDGLTIQKVIICWNFLSQLSFLVLLLQKDYVPYVNAQPAKSMRQTGYRLSPDGGFDDRTIYRCAYEPFYYDDGQYKDCIPAADYDYMYPPSMYPSSTCKKCLK